jgi:hypothetical protein
MIRVGGTMIDQALMEAALDHLAYMLEKPDT